MLEGLASNGYNIWYDQGIEISKTWSDEIANAIMASEIFVVFVTKDAMASNYVRSEVEFAISKNIKVVPVYLQSIDVLPPGLALALHSTQGVHSGDAGDIVFKLNKWLAQNIQKETWQPVKSSISSSSQYLSAVKKQQEKKYAAPIAEEEPVKIDEKYWENFYGNMHGAPAEDNEKYVSLGVHAVSSRPFMAMLLCVIFLVSVTEIFKAYLEFGFNRRPFVTALITWGLPSAVFYWYFFRRSTMRISFFEKVLPGVMTFLPLLYWSCLLGWLLERVSLETFKIWLPYIDKVLRFARVDMGLSQYMYLSLPQIPGVIRSAASFIFDASGVCLAVDAVITAVMSFFPQKT